MNFFSPLSLLWLIPLAGLVVLMYILKLRRKDVVVSSTFLWQQVIRDVQANAPFQKLRKNLLLLLQLIAVLLLVLLISRPFWRGKGIGGRSVVIVMDTSASMAATDERPTRLDQAKTRALKLVDEMKPEDQMMVISASSRPEASTGFTAERSELARAINSLKTRETTTNIRDAVNLAAALVATRDAARIDVISDGAFPSITNVNLGKAFVAFHPVGLSSANVGIAAVDYRHSLTGAEEVQVFVTVRNFDKTARTVTVELAHDRELLDAQEVTLYHGEEHAQSFDLPEPAEPVTLTVRLETDDSLDTDNRAALVINPRKPIKALLVGGDNPFLVNGINVDPAVELTHIKLADFKSPAGYDVVVFDGEAPKTLPEGNYFFINSSSDRSPASPLGEHENQGLIDPDRAHPVLRYVEFGSTRWTRMSAGKPAPWAREIASSESGAAIAAGEVGRSRSIWTGFDMDVAHGQFPLTVGYPIFIANALRWLSGSDEVLHSQIRTGTPIALDPPAGIKNLTVTKPDGSNRTVAVPVNAPSGAAVFDEVDQVGIYSVSGEGGYRRLFAANLADYAESDITPRRNPDLGAGAPAQPGRRVTVTREIWPYLAFLLLALLAFEWYAFHRRVFVS